MDIHRNDHEPPLAIATWGWRFHHIGIPTDRPVSDETYHPLYGFFTGGFDTSPFGIEWMRFEAGSPCEELIRRVPHVAFEVDDLDLELRRRNFRIISLPGSPSAGVRTAMIEHNGAPVELIEFSK